MSKHTPGPWKIKEGQFYCAIRTDSGVIANMRYVGQVTNKANARLIAAAPELLSLLKRYRDETPIGHQPHMIAHEADVLIDKIEGK